MFLISNWKLRKLGKIWIKICKSTKKDINQHERDFVITKLIKNPLITRSVNYIAPLFCRQHAPSTKKLSHVLFTQSLAVIDIPRQYVLIMVATSSLKLPMKKSISLILWKKCSRQFLRYHMARSYDASYKAKTTITFS